MSKIKNEARESAWLGLAALAGLLLAGCQTSTQTAPPQPAPTPPPAAASTAAPMPAPAAVAAPAPAATTPAPPPMPVTKSQGIVRIKAGATEPFTDAEGNLWLADQGFADGETAARTDIKIENTKNPSLYMTERYGMTSFAYPAPNGKYLVKLHFAETYDGITGPGQRVFSVAVQGHEIKDLDVWAKAGGPLRAYVESVPVEVTDGKARITFAANVQNPEINAIEIIPQS